MADMKLNSLREETHQAIEMAQSSAKSMLSAAENQNEEKQGAMTKLIVTLQKELNTLKDAKYDQSINMMQNKIKRLEEELETRRRAPEMEFLTKMYKTDWKLLMDKVNTMEE